MKSRKSSGIIKIINYMLILLIVGLCAWVFNIVFKYKILNFNKINYILLGIILLIIALTTVFATSLKSVGQKILLGFQLFMIILLGGGGYYLNNTVNMFKKVNEAAQISENTVAVAVTKESQIKDITDLKTEQVLAPIERDKSNIEKFQEELSKEKGFKLNLLSSESYIKAYDQLIAGNTEAMLISSAHASLLELHDQDYKNKINIIYQVNIKSENKVISANKETTVEKKTGNNNKKEESNAFNVYISGIDTYGSLSTVSRSDVNILMTVNPDTGKILLTSTPRDSYVRIPGDGGNEYDKLTHAGIYGVMTSVATLEQLYGITIKNYARINFTTFINLIDLLGGVEVNNDYAFNTDGGYYFEAGNITLTSESALAFVRERHHLDSGDFDRGRNQMKVIEGIIKKLQSKDALLNAQGIFNQVSDSMQTDITLEQVMDLANKLLSSGKSFDIEQQSLKGYGTMALPSYAMPGYSLYMMQVDSKSLEDVTANINSVLGN